MNSSPAKLMWPWSKRAKEKRAFRRFEKATEVRDGKTYLKDDYEVNDGDLTKISNREKRNRQEIANQKHRDKLSQLSNEELENLRGKSPEEVSSYLDIKDTEVPDESSKYSL